MADEISGINMIVTQGGTAITDQSDATLTSTPELAESVVKNTNFPNRLPGDQNWSVDLETQIPTDGGEDALVNGNAGLEVELDLDDDGTPSYERVSGVQSLTLSLSQELSEVPPGISEATGWDYFVPLRQSWETDAEAHYYDPANDDVYAAIHNARENGNALPGRVTILGVEMDGDLVADDFEIAAGTDDPATQSLPMMGSGEVTRSNSFESTIESLVSLFFNQSTATIGLQHETDGSVATGSTLWSGDAYLESAEITLERNSFPVLSATFQGDGPLSRTTQ